AMRRSTRRALLTASLLAAVPILPVMAQTGSAAPRLEPSRDVAVTYRTLGGKPEPVEAQWLASERLLRLELPRQNGWGVLDRRSGQARLVMDKMRLVTELPAEELQKMGLPADFGPGTRFTREGQAKVAGLSCTNWRYEERDASGRACLTADGVLLRAEGQVQGRQGGIEATSVTYARQDPDRFRIPAGYQTLQLPQGLPPGLAQNLLGVIPGLKR
ncbi:hypothetical protein ACX4MV_05760, partial [Roseomonas mucosa]